MWAMDFPDVGIGWVSGFGGIVLHTEDGGGTMTYETYERPSIDLPIPDPGEVSDTLEVEIFPRKPAATVISGLTVLIDSLTHPNLSDLILLLAHGGVTDTLVAEGEMSGSHIGRCSFSDGSSTPVGDGEAPYADAYRPHNPLSAFHGMDPLGAWKLSVLDLVSGNAGTLHSWGVRISAESVTGADDGVMEVPERFILYQNYPNPFNPSTTIRYALPRAGHVRLAVFNVLGQESRILVNGTEAAGDHSVQLDAAGLPTGVYFYQLQSGGYSSTRKLLVVH